MLYPQNILCFLQWLCAYIWGYLNILNDNGILVSRSLFVNTACMQRLSKYWSPFHRTCQAITNQHSWQLKTTLFSIPVQMMLFFSKADVKMIPCFSAAALAVILILEVTIRWMFTMCQEEWTHSIFVIIWEGRPWYSKFPLETAWFREVKWLFLYLTGPPGFKYRFYWSEPKLCPLNYTFKKSTNHEIGSWQNCSFSMNNK